MGLALTGLLQVDNTAPTIQLTETDVPNAKHRIIASGGVLYIQVEDGDGTTDGDLYLTGMNSADARLVAIRAVTTTMNGNLEVTGSITSDTGLLAGADAAAGAIGTYVWATHAASGTATAQFVLGTTYAGTALYPAGFGSFNASAGTAGTTKYSSGSAIASNLSANISSAVSSTDGSTGAVLAFSFAVLAVLGSIGLSTSGCNNGISPLILT